VESETEERMIESLLWGSVAAVPLIIGAALAMVRSWPPRALGIVLGFGAGALIASIAFELWEEGYDAGGAVPLVTGLAAGALTYFVADRVVTRFAMRSGSAAGIPLAIGALLDGIPEQLVLGIGLAAGEGVSVALVVAIFVSNLPESIGSAADMLDAKSSRRSVLTLWTGVAVLCVLATIAGYLLADNTGGAFQAGASGFAAGALLVMLVDSMVPEAQEKAKDVTGLATVLGFTVAAGLSLLG
jgi:ZIP family zinc transporter